MAYPNYVDSSSMEPHLPPRPAGLSSEKSDDTMTPPYTTNTHHKTSLPPLNLTLSAHKKAIFIGWFPIVLTSGILPIVGFFALRNGTTEKLSICLAPWLALMGASSLYALGTRTYSLLRKDGSCLPLGLHVQQKWQMDFFEWNYIFGFLALTGLISAGSSVQNLTIVTLPVSVIILYVAAEMVLVRLLMVWNVRAPFRMSSVQKGEILRPASYVIVEDVVAVDGKQGRAFRYAWSERYEASPVLRRYLMDMDLLWGISGLCLVALIWGLAFGLQHMVKGQYVAYGLGWAIPWIWAGIMAWITIGLTKRMLRREHSISIEA